MGQLINITEVGRSHPTPISVSDVRSISLRDGVTHVTVKGTVHAIAVKDNVYVLFSLLKKAAQDRIEQAEYSLKRWTEKEERTIQENNTKKEI